MNIYTHRVMDSKSTLKRKGLGLILDGLLKMSFQV